MIHVHYRIALVFMLFCPSLSAIAQVNEAQLKTYLAAADKAETEDDYVSAMTSADSFARKANDVAAQAKINQSMGSHYFNIDADESIKYSQKAFRLFTTAGNKKDAALCLQNLAFVYVEKKKDYPEAMKYLKRTVNARMELQDTLSAANMLKYQAMVYGKMHDYKAGKASAAKAIHFFTIKNFTEGVAVSYLDLALVFEEERQYDSAIAYVLKAKEIWTAETRKAKYQNRIYGNNAALIRMYDKADNSTEAEAMIHENEAIDASKLYDVELMSFYKEARDFYARNKDKENAKIYREKYAVLLQKQKDEGKNIE